MPEDQEQNVSAPIARRGLDWLAERLRQTIGWAKVHRLKAAVALGASLASLAALVALGVVVATAGRSSGGSLAAAMAALDAARYEDARKIAESLRSQAHPSLDTLAGTALVLGVATAAEAEQSYPGQAARLYLVAAEYLDEANDRGFPKGWEAEGLYLLGKSLYASGQYPQCRPVLRDALALNPDRASEIHRLLSAAYLNDANPDYAQALEHNTLLLADRTLLPHRAPPRTRGAGDDLPPPRTPGRMPAHARRDPRFGRQPAEAMLVRGQVLMRPAAEPSQPMAEGQPSQDERDRQAEALEKYQEAVKMLRQAQSYDTLTAQVSGPAMYLTGVCYMASRRRPGRLDAVGPRQADLSRHARRRGRRISAWPSLHANWATTSKRWRLTSACCARSPTRGAYHNRWLTLDELQATARWRPTASISTRKNSTRPSPWPSSSTPPFPACGRWSWSARPIGRGERNSWPRASTCRRARPNNRPPGPPSNSASAGSVYRRLAELRVATRQYPEDLWASAECYLDGASFTQRGRDVRAVSQEPVAGAPAPGSLGPGRGAVGAGQTRRSAAAR